MESCQPGVDKMTCLGGFRIRRLAVMAAPSARLVGT